MKKFLLAILVVMLALFVSCKKSEIKADPFESYVSRVEDLVKTNWPHMDKVWPSYDYKNHNLIVFYLDTEEENIKEAWLFNVEGARKLEEKEYKGITPPGAGGFLQVNFEGKVSIAMSVTSETIEENDSVRQLYRTATHELVHFVYQDEVISSEETSRNQQYPITIEPRLIRKMLYTRLIEAFEHPQQEEEFLGKAKFWLEKYQKEHKEEANSIRYTDITESTARYTENLATIIGKDLSIEERRKEIEKDIVKDENFISADGESYEIGFVAALLLDRRDPSWKETFYQSRKNVEEVLLEHILPIEDKVDSKIESSLQEKINTVNEEAKEALKDIILAEADKSIPYLRLETAKSTGSITSGGMYEYKGFHILEAYSKNFVAQGKSIEVKKLSVIDVYDIVNPTITMPLSMNYEIKDGVLTVKTEHLLVDSIPVTEKEEEGRKIYTIRVDQ